MADVYRCPVCAKPFDRTDDLFDFAVAAHEKGHAASRNDPSNLIALNGEGTWCCTLCGHPFGAAEEFARIAVIGHARQKHGSTPASSAPVTARGGTRAGGAGFGRRIGDLVEDVGEALGNAIGKILGD